jgi:thiamine-phosphate pyrophosphorylase
VVAIGGITLETAVSVIEAGADGVSVISDILCAPDRVRRARQYLEVLGRANRTASV